MGGAGTAGQVSMVPLQQQVITVVVVAVRVKLVTVGRSIVQSTQADGGDGLNH